MQHISPELHERRERVFLCFAGLFLGSMVMLNILGITRFVDLSFSFLGWEIPLVIAIGVLPYPVTFLCTDFISELYGRRRANFLVWLGCGLNLWVVFVLWLGGVLPPSPVIDPSTGLPPAGSPDYSFFHIKVLTLGTVGASMIAYLSAQLIDVHLFHFWKRFTRGRHLWLRNNGSTLVSQMVDTVAVVLIGHFYAGAMPIDQDEAVWPQLFTLIAAAYVFKMAAALLDTVPFYLGTAWLSRYLRIDVTREHNAELEAAT